MRLGGTFFGIIIAMVGLLMFLNYETLPVYGYLGLNESESYDRPFSLSRGLVGYWDFDEYYNDYRTVNGTVYDSSGYGNDGLYYNWSFDKYHMNGEAVNGSALGFDGTDDVNITTGAYSSFTVSAWIYPESYLAGSNMPIISKYDLRGGLFINGNAHTLLVYNTTQSTQQSLGTIPLNEWTHVTLTYDSGTTTFCIDAVCESFSFPTGATNFDYIGREAAYSVFFNGTIDDVRIYNRALTPYEVSALYYYYENRAYYFASNFARIIGMLICLFGFIVMLVSL
jgi:hypothetical protein